VVGNRIETHNRRQQDYFGARIKSTMRPDRTPYIIRQLEELIEFGSLHPGERILEVGCGMGRHAFLLSERGFVVEGLELSSFLIDRLREFDGGRYNIPVYCGDIHRPPTELRGPYDAVVGFFVLHHLADLSEAFKSMASLLRPAGKVVFLEPNPYNPLFYLQIFLTPGMSWDAERGLVRMRPRTLFPAMKAAGFTRMAIKRFGFFPPILANTTWGRRVERILENFKPWHAILPFQIFKAELSAELV